MLGIEPSKYELILTQNSKSYTVSIPMIRAMIASTSTVINTTETVELTVITTVYMLPLEALSSDEMNK